MKINNLVINNFRSIKNISVNLNDFTMFIGANNSGKTNIIDALRIFYEKEIKFTPIKDLPKFSNNNNEDSWIEIEYTLSDDEYNNLREEYKVNRNFLKIRKYLKSSNSNLVKSNQSNLFAYEKDGLSNNLFYGAKNISEAKLGDIIYIPEIAKVDEYTKLSGPSAFRSLLEFVVKKVVKGSNSFDLLESAFLDFNENFKDEVSSDGLSIQGLVNDINNEIKDWDINFGIDVNQIKPEEIIKNLVKHYIEDKNLNGQKLDATYFGQGLQRHLIYTLIKLSSKYKEAPKTKDKKEFNPDFTLMLFEEPEAFLHPGQQEILNLNLRDLAVEENQQIIITTHSTHFVSNNFDEIPSIIRLSKNGPETEKHQIDQELLRSILEENLEIKNILGVSIDEKAAELEAIRYYLWLNPDRCCSFFAEKVLICEGPSEKSLIDYLIKTKKIVLNDKVYIFNADGKYGIHKYMSLFFNLGIKHGVLFDKDSDKGKHEKLNNFIRSKKNSLTIDMYCFNSDIEGFLEIEKPANGSQKPFYILWDYQNNKISESKISDLNNIVQKLLN